jgi:ABC-type multidrug transport system fused ATPase/permease subunit
MKINKKNLILKVYRYFLPSAWKKYKGYFVVRFAKLLVTAALPFIPILIMPSIIDELLGNREAGKLINYVVMILSAEFILHLMNGILGNLIERYAVKFENYYKAIMSGRIMELDFQLTEDKKALDQIELAKNGMSWYSGGLNGIVEPLFNMVSSIITLLGVIYIIARRAPILLVVITVILFFTTLINAKLNQIEQKNYAELSKLNRIFGYMGWELTDFRYGKDIRLYGAREMMVEKWRYHSGITSKQWETTANKQLPLELLMMITDIIRDFGTYFYVGMLAITGKITIGVTTQMFTSAGTFYSSMRGLITAFQDLTKRANYANEYVKFMEYPAAIYKGSRHIQKGPHTFELRNVCFTYPNTNVSVLQGVNLTLTQGEHLSVVGLNGAGKTTLIKLLCRLYDPTEGEILLDGVNIREYDYVEYMELFAPVFQDFKLFAFSMKENLLMGKYGTEEREDRLNDIMKKVGLSGKLSSLKKGVDTMIYKHFDEDGIEPSGGEQQKVAIARALYKDAPVVILDEPTAALDPIAEYEIYRQFEDLVNGKTAIYISHRLSSCQFCDRIAVFADGMVKEYGTHTELVKKSNGIYAEMFTAQAQYYVS